MDKSQRRIRRSPSVKRRSKVLPVGQRLTLERVLGLTVSSNAAFTCDPVSGVIAYPAGDNSTKFRGFQLIRCVVVLFNSRRNRQSHIFNVSKKTITAVAFSADGKYLVTGECGHQPAVRVWEVEERTQVAELHGHKFGVNCVAFSPNLKFIVSIGSQYDMMVNVWNWRTGDKVASNKVSWKVSAVSFGADSSCFVTVGNRHVKFWYLDTTQSKINQTMPLLGHSGILGEHKNNYFCDVVCGRGKASGSTYVITQSGLLCEFNDKRLLDKWVELRTKRANCVTAGEEHIYIGCGAGVVRVFSASSLQFVATLPCPHHLGVDVASATSSSDLVCTKTDADYPDVIAVSLDDDRKKVSCVYNDHSLYVWDVLDVQRVGKAWSFLFHSGCVWALEVYPQVESGQTAALPPGSFLTASSDNTVRVWNLDSPVSHSPRYTHNVYSTELLKIMYTDPDHSFLCDVDYNPAGGADKTDRTWEGRQGVRSIRLSPDGLHLASGDRQGNIRIYDLKQMSEIRCIEAHESDVVCLEYSFSKSGPRILASGSRDRLIHVFDVDQHYGLLQTLDDHSAAIQSVRFSQADSNTLRMLSCGSDKSLLFRNATLDTELEFSLDQHLVSKSTMYDMIIHPSHKFVATACQDRNVRIYNMKTAKQKKHYGGSVGEEGTLLRVQLDPSGTYAATSCTDKNVCVLDFYTGELAATVYGHSEIVTGLRFTNDLKHLISVSADGCIFVWRVSTEMTKTMRMRMEELGKVPKEETFGIYNSTFTTSPSLLPGTKPSTTTNCISPASVLASMEPHCPPPPTPQPPQSSPYPHTPLGRGLKGSPPPPSPAHLLSLVGPLPGWANPQWADEPEYGCEDSVDRAQPKGRWAQRFDHNLAFMSQLDLSCLDTTQADGGRLTGLDGGGGGLQGGALACSMPDLRRETVVLSSHHLPAKNIPIIDDDDETNVDDDEDFFPGYMKDSLPKSENDCTSSDGDGRRRTQNGGWLGGRLSSRVGDGRWSNGTSFGSEDTTQGTDCEDMEDSDAWPDATRIIYPPCKHEIKKRTRRRTVSNNMDQADGETGRQMCVEERDGEDGSDDVMVTLLSSQSIAHDAGLQHTSDKERFVKEHFDSVSFTPVGKDTFAQQVASLEQAAQSSTDKTGLPFSPRLSLSSRFLSRSHFVGIRSGVKVGARRNLDDNFNMNWRTGGLIHESPEKDDPHSPPTKLEKEPSFSTPVASSHGYPVAGGKLEMETSPIHSVPTQDLPSSPSRRMPSPSCRTSRGPSQRSSLAPSKRNKRTSSEGVHSHEAKGPRSASVPPSPRQAPSYSRTTKSSRLKSVSSGNLVKQAESQKSVSSGSMVKQAESQKSVSSGSMVKQTDSKKSVSSSSLVKQTDSHKSVSSGSMVKQAESQKSVSSGSMVKQAESHKSASSGSMVKQAESQKSVSSSSMVKPTESRREAGCEERGKLGRKTRKGRLSLTSSQARHKSTPNLMACPEAEKEGTAAESRSSNLCELANLSFSEPDIFSVENPASTHAAVTGAVQANHGAVHGHPHNSSSSPGRRSFPTGNTANRSYLPKQDGDATDTQLMPPTLSVSSHAQHSLMRRAAHAKKRSASDLTLDQAKCILLGNSGILQQHSNTDVVLGASGETSAQGSADGVTPSEAAPATGSLASHRNSDAASITTMAVSRSVSPHSTSPREFLSTLPSFHDTTTTSNHGPATVSTEERILTGSQPTLDRSQAPSAVAEVVHFDVPQHDQPRRPKPQCGNGTVKSVHDMLSISTPEGYCDRSDGPLGGQVFCNMAVQDEMTTFSQKSSQRDSLGRERSSVHARACQGSNRVVDTGQSDMSSPSLRQQSPLQSDAPCSRLVPDHPEALYDQSPQGLILQGEIPQEQIPQGETPSSFHTQGETLPSPQCGTPSSFPQGQTPLPQTPSAQRETLSSSQTPSSSSSSPQTSSCSQSPEQGASPRSQSDTGLGSDTDTDTDTLHYPLSLSGGEERTEGGSLNQLSPHHHHSSFTASPLASDRNQELWRRCTSIVADLKAAVQRAKDFHSELTQNHLETPATHNKDPVMSQLSEAIHHTHLTLARLALHPSLTPHTHPHPRYCPLMGGEAVATWDSGVLDQARSMLGPFMRTLSQELSREVVRVVQERLDEGSSSSSSSSSRPAVGLSSRSLESTDS